tara:strand:- start:462 stop:1019 length:558 start_codon:yes stop_codon:yes gene_type:complete
MECSDIEKQIDDLIKMGGATDLLPSRPDIGSNGIQIATKEDIVKFEKHVLSLKSSLPGIYGDGIKLVRDCPDALISHEFVEGIYIRQMDMKTGCLVISAVHKHKHCWFLLTGHITVTTELGKEDFVAPCKVISPSGIKRIIYANEPSLFINVHENPSNTRDLDEVEENTWAMNYNEYNDYVKNKK